MRSPLRHSPRLCRPPSKTCQTDATENSKGFVFRASFEYPPIKPFRNGHVSYSCRRNTHTPCLSPHGRRKSRITEYENRIFNITARDKRTKTNKVYNRILSVVHLLFPLVRFYYAFSFANFYVSGRTLTLIFLLPTNPPLTSTM